MANILVKLLMDATGYEKGLQGAAGRTKAFEAAAKTVTGTIGKIAGAFGLAIGSAEAFQKIIKGSQTTSDEYDRVLRSMKTSVDAFFTSISTGDFSAFALGLDDLISKARSANDALDQLGNTTMSYGYFSSKERAEFADAIKVLRDKNSTEAELKAAEAQMKGALERLQGYTEVYAKRSAEAMSSLVVEGTLLSAGQITQERIDEVLRLDVSTMGAEEKAALAARYKEYQAEIKRIKGEYTSYSVDVKGESLIKNFDEKGFRKAMEPVNALYLDAIVYDQVLVKKNDEWLQQLINISKAASDAGRSLAEMYNQQREGLNAAATTRAARAKAGAGAVIGLPSAPGLSTEMQGFGSVGETLQGTLMPVEAMNTYEKQLEEIAKRQKEVADTAMYAGQMFGAMGQLAAQSGNEALAGVMNSFGAVADMIVQLQSLATAQGVASAAALPFPANMGAIATVLSTIASVWSSLNFAEGGIVPGSNYMDGITARVSSGEMVINTADQKRLYDAIHTGNLGGGGGGRMVVSGEQIVEVVNNYGQRTGKGRLTFK
jgi:hypothetical protein